MGVAGRDRDKQGYSFSRYKQAGMVAYSCGQDLHCYEVALLICGPTPTKKDLDGAGLVVEWGMSRQALKTDWL